MLVEVLLELLYDVFLALIIDNVESVLVYLVGVLTVLLIKVQEDAILFQFEQNRVVDLGKVFSDQLDLDLLILYLLLTVGVGVFVELLVEEFEEPDPVELALDLIQTCLAFAREAQAIILPVEHGVGPGIFYQLLDVTAISDGAQRQLLIDIVLLLHIKLLHLDLV